MKKISSLKEFIRVIKNYPYITFDMDSYCRVAPYGYGDLFCEKVLISSKLRKELDIDILTLHKFKYIYLFPSLKHVKNFLDLNIQLYEDNVELPYSKHICSTLLITLATSGLLLQYDYRFLKIYRRYREKGVIEECSSWRKLNRTIIEIKEIISSIRE